MICARCEGDGWIEVWSADGLNMTAATCPDCGGSGSVTPFDNATYSPMEAS